MLLLFDFAADILCSCYLARYLVLLMHAVLINVVRTTLNSNGVERERRRTQTERELFMTAYCTGTGQVLYHIEPGRGIYQ